MEEKLTSKPAHIGPLLTGSSDAIVYRTGRSEIAGLRERSNGGCVRRHSSRVEIILEKVGVDVEGGCQRDERVWRSTSSPMAPLNAARRSSYAVLQQACEHRIDDRPAAFGCAVSPQRRQVLFATSNGRKWTPWVQKGLEVEGLTPRGGMCSLGPGKAWYRLIQSWRWVDRGTRPTLIECRLLRSCGLPHSGVPGAGR